MPATATRKPKVKEPAFMTFRNTLNGHPMEQKVLKALMDGESLRSVGRWISPNVSKSAISRYVQQKLKPAIKNATLLSSVLAGIDAQPPTNQQVNETVPPVPLEMSPVPPVLSPVPAPVPPKRPNLNVPDPEMAVGSGTERGMMVRQALAAAPILRIRENRIAFQQNLADRLASVIQERGEEMAACEACGREKSEHPAVGHADGLKDCAKFRRIPGGSSGLMTRRLKKDGVEYHYDNAIVASAQELMKQTAIEQGQWQENMGTGAPTIQIICPQVPGELPRVSFHADDAIEGEFADIGLDQGR